MSVYYVHLIFQSFLIQIEEEKNFKKCYANLFHIDHFNKTNTVTH